MHGDSDRDGGERHGPEHERNDRADAALKFLPRRIERTRHQQRRQHGREQQVRVHVGYAPAGDRDHTAAERRDRDALSEPGQGARAADQQQQVMKKLDVVHPLEPRGWHIDHTVDDAGENNGEQRKHGQSHDASLGW
ncbi:hypothetical protein OKW49_000665 [Paraburkholderia youngii]